MKRVPWMSWVLSRRRRTAALVAVALLMVASLVGLQRATIARAGAAERKPYYSGDWTHIYEVITTLEASRPKVPVVYLRAVPPAAVHDERRPLRPPRSGGWAAAHAPYTLARTV